MEKLRPAWFVVHAEYMTEQYPNDNLYCTNMNLRRFLDKKGNVFKDLQISTLDLDSALCGHKHVANTWWVTVFSVHNDADVIS